MVAQLPCQQQWSHAVRLTLVLWWFCFHSSLPVTEATTAATPWMAPAPPTTYSVKEPKMPWNPNWHESWPVLACAVGVWLVWWFGLFLCIIFSRQTNMRFGTFYRGYISAYLSEAWYMSVWMMPLMALLIFILAVCRHPTHSPTGATLSWNVMALIIVGLGCVGLAGCGVISTREVTTPSAYPLQNNVLHAAFTWMACIGLFMYMVFQTGVTFYDIVHSPPGMLPRLVIVVQIILIVSAALHFTLWVIEIRSWGCNERDPRCNQVFEWWCVFSFLAYLLTMPILVLCAHNPKPFAQGIGVVGSFALGIFGIWLLFFSHMLSTAAGRETRAWAQSLEMSYMQRIPIY